jgi:broad specificity phosphatase PhoE
VPASTRLYLARHCDVANPRRVVYGHLPGYALSPLGLAQAEAMGRRLAGRPIRLIRSSPLPRALQTAGIVAGHLGNPPIVSDPDLVEARFGRYLQGVPYAQVPWRRPLWWVHMAWPGLLPSDETVAEMGARVEAALLRLLDEVGDGSGVCVSHGDPIQAFWIRALGRPAWALHRLQCAKGGMLELDYRGRRLETISYVPPGSVEAAATGTPASGALSA